MPVQCTLSLWLAYLCDNDGMCMQTSVPWSTQRCVALTRALYQCFQLQESFPPNQPRMYSGVCPLLLLALPAYVLSCSHP